MKTDFKLALTPGDYAAFGQLCRLYVDWCRARYADMPWLIEEIFGYQSLDIELQQLAVKYGPPRGFTMLASRDSSLVAGGAVQRMDDGICELKRVYVTEDAKGLGLGRQLTLALMEEAKRRGFHTMRLDTADRLTEAQSLYRSLGFYAIDPYLDYPDKLLPHLMFMEMRLG